MVWILSQFSPVLRSCQSKITVFFSRSTGASLPLSLDGWPSACAAIVIWCITELDQRKWLFIFISLIDGSWGPSFQLYSPLVCLALSWQMEMHQYLLDQMTSWKLRISTNGTPHLVDLIRWLGLFDREIFIFSFISKTLLPAISMILITEICSTRPVCWAKQML